MSKKLAATNYFEPWEAARMHRPRPNTEGIPDEIAFDIQLRWEQREEGAPWFVWASNMADPVEVCGLLGSKAVMDDRRIVATLNRLLGAPDGCPSHEMFAKRIVACVNAMQGVLDPDHFVRYAKELMVQKAKERR